LFREHFDLHGGLLDLGLAASGQLEDLAATRDVATVQPSGVVQVGNALGDGGSRSALNAPAPPLATAVVVARRVAKNSKGRLMSDEDADALITGARAAAMTMAAQRPLTTVPTNLKQALMAPDRDLWIAAISKEISRLKEKVVWEEVLRFDVPAGTSVVPSQLCFAVKSDGTRKCRWVAQGDLMKEGQHYIAIKSSMAAIEAVRMQAALAAGAGWEIYQIDFEQAFVCTPADSDGLYLELPEVPPEFEG